MNKNFPQVFVMDPSTNLVTGNTVTPNQLTLNQLGIFVSDQFSVPGVGATATPTAAILQLHQNFGDSKFGTVRTRPIEKTAVKRYYGTAATTRTTQVQFIGWNGTTGDIVVPYNTEVDLHITVYNKNLMRWYGASRPYKRTVSLYFAGAPGTVPKATVAAEIAAQINSTNLPGNAYGDGNELKNYLTATVPAAGGGGELGVRIETKAITPQLLTSAANPVRFFEVELTTFEIFVASPAGSTTSLPVSQTQAATTGSGFPAELAALEAESQGYNRVREVFDHPKFMKDNYVIFAQDGKKYDYLHLVYDWTHDTNAMGATNGKITEEYELIIAAPTTTLQATANVFNSWLTGRFAAVTL